MLYFRDLRKLILDRCWIIQLCDLRYKVFEDAEIGGNAIFVLMKGERPHLKTKLIQAHSVDSFVSNTKNLEVNQVDFYKINDNKFIFDLAVGNLLKKIEKKGKVLDQLAIFYQGIITGDNKKFLSTRKINQQWKPIIRGKDIDRYKLKWGNQYVWFNKSLLWSNADESKFNVKEKLISRQTSDHLAAVFDDHKYLTLDSTHVIIPQDVDSKYLLALFNSKLLNFYYQKNIPEVGKTFAQVKIVNLKTLPIRMLNLSVPSEGMLRYELINLVDKMLELCKKLELSSFASQREPIEHQIAATDKKIDELVYKLYGLTEEEIKIVEGK